MQQCIDQCFNNLLLPGGKLVVQTPERPDKLLRTTGSLSMTLKKLTGGRIGLERLPASARQDTRANGCNT